MLDDKERAMIDEALSQLAQANGDHWCDNVECTLDTPCCAEMHNRAAARRLREIVEPKMVSLHPNRLTNPAERIYFDRWLRENLAHDGINHGYTALEIILCPPENQPKDFGGDNGNVPRPSQRDAEVATAIIQWLGTNCGHGFVLGAEKQIEEERAERSEFYLLSDRYTDGHRRDMFQRMLNFVLNNVLPSPARGANGWKTNAYGLQKLRHEISRVMRTVFTLYAFGSGKASAEECAAELGVSVTEFRRLNEHAEKAVDDAVARTR